jgi:hypothetical protein
MSFLWLAVSIAFATCSNIIIKSRSLVNAGNDGGIDYVIRMALDPWVWAGGVMVGVAATALILASLSRSWPSYSSLFQSRRTFF